MSRVIATAILLVLVLAPGCGRSGPALGPPLPPPPGQAPAAYRIPAPVYQPSYAANPPVPLPPAPTPIAADPTEQTDVPQTVSGYAAASEVTPPQPKFDPYSSSSSSPVSDTPVKKATDARAVPAERTAIKTKRRGDEPLFQGKPASHWYQVARDLDPEFRGVAIPALAAFARHEGDKESIEILSSIVASATDRSESSLRLTAMQSLGGVARQREVAGIVPLLLKVARETPETQTNQNGIHIQALYALANTHKNWKSPESIKAFTASLDHPNSRNIAAIGMVYSGPENTDRALRSLKSQKGAPNSAAASLGTLFFTQPISREMSANLVSVLKSDSDEDLHPDALQALMSVAHGLKSESTAAADEVVDLCVDILESPRKELHLSSLQLLRILNKAAAKAEATLHELLASPDETVADQAADALAAITTDADTTVKKLISSFDKAPANQKAAVVRALGQLTARADDAIDLLKKQVESKDELLRSRSLVALAMIGAEFSATKESLKAAIESESQLVVRGAIEAITVYGVVAAEMQQYLLKLVQAAEKADDRKTSGLLHRAINATMVRQAREYSSIGHVAPVGSSSPVPAVNWPKRK